MKQTKILVKVLICLTFLTGIATAQNATVILTFDDGWYSVLQNAKPIMDANNQQGVEFIIANQPELSWNGQSNNYMNVSQLQQLYDSGWDLSSHTYSHMVLTTANTTTLNFELNTSKDWLDNHGFSRGAMFLAYPEGQYNPTVISAVQADHYVAARTVDPLNGSYAHYNLTSPANELFVLKDYEIIGGIDNENMVITQINNAVSANGLLILSFHKIVDTFSANASDAETEFLTSDFRNISNYLKTLSDNGSVTVTTLSGYFGVTPLPRYMPLTPTNLSTDMRLNLNSSTINVSWIPGIGNKTDLYNIYFNGTRFNDSVNPFVNITVIPGQLFNLSVYAVNTTNGNTLNSVPAYLNMTIPLMQKYMPSTPINLTAIYGNATNGNGTILLQWEQGPGGDNSGNMTNANATDFYNMSINNFLVINGTLWINEIKNNSYNLTNIVPGTIYTIKVYAVNSTNGTTMNQTPVMINVTYLSTAYPLLTNFSYGYYWMRLGLSDGCLTTNCFKSDLYNYSVEINGTKGNWTITNDSIINISILPHALVNITIYGVNTTYGWAQSHGYLFVSESLPNSPIELRNIWAEYEVYAGDALRINPTIYNIDNDTYTLSIFDYDNSTNTISNATNISSFDNITGALVLNTKSGDQGIRSYAMKISDGYSYHELHFKVYITTKPIYNSIGGGGNNGGGGGGNNGGGGGASVYDPNAEFYERRDSQIRHNAESNVEFFKNNLVTNVSFYGLRNYGEVTVKIALLKGSPKPGYLNNTYKFFSVTLDTISEQLEYLYINKTAITIRVNKSNLSGNNIKAYRYINDSWKSVEITDINIEDNLTKQFRLKSDGLSNFAIVLEPIEPIDISAPIGNNSTDYKNVSITGNTAVDKVIKQVVPESLYRQLINLIKKYMWWI